MADACPITNLRAQQLPSHQRSPRSARHTKETNEPAIEPMTSWRNRSTASPESPLIAASPSYDAGDRVHAMAGETTMDDNTAVGCEDDPAIRHVLGAGAAAAAGGHDDDSANENVVAAAVGLEGEAYDDATAVHVLTADGHTTQEELGDRIAQKLIVPEVGMAFESEIKAYEMYNAYAGHRETDSSQDTRRTGCNARVQFSVSREGLWKVQKVVLDHNHYLASPDKTHKLRSQRRVIEADRKLIAQIREAGMKPAQVFEFMKEFYGGADKVPFSKMDCNNEIGRERREYLESNDAQTLLEYLKNKQLEDPAFFYAAQIDKEDGRIANFFWADGQSIMDYACFGDAVSFDTTFQTNKFEMPFAPLLGTNHHKQTIIFGAALLFNETIESFVWLFETFVEAMSGKHPSTIFTDQDAAMAGAIAYVFRNTSHRLCLWHIYLNAAN
ncbi:hypothetical protein ACP70R_020911 [Stipagrostis hirtigluma subsp. patula]